MRGLTGRFAVVLIAWLTATGHGQQPATRYDQPLVDAGMQALLTCNGLFVSHRTLDQLYAAELKLEGLPFTPAGDVTIDHGRRTVAVPALGGQARIMRAAYREGLGCVVLGPEQTFADVDALPELALPAPAGNPADIPWPDGDRVDATPLPDEINARALESAANAAFNRSSRGHPSQVTLSLLVVYKGRIVLERYAPGVDVTTRTRTWSTAKSIAATLVGIAISGGIL